MAKRPKTVKRRCFEDVFSAGIWLASAPLHEAERTRKSASTLKAKQGIGQLDFVSDNSDALFNAYLQILSSSKPHSEVASTSRESPPEDKILLAGRILSQVERCSSLCQIERLTFSRKSASPSVW